MRTLNGVSQIIQDADCTISRRDSDLRGEVRNCVCGEKLSQSNRIGYTTLVADFYAFKRLIPLLMNIAFR